MHPQKRVQDLRKCYIWNVGESRQRGAVSATAVGNGSRPGKRKNLGTKLSHDLSFAKMTSEVHRVVVLISGSGKPNNHAGSIPPDPNRHQERTFKP